MHESFINYIRAHSSTPLTEGEIEIIKKTFIPKKLRKRQFFLQEGDVCKYYAFIVKGAMRQYSVDENGVEHIVRLSIENWWLGDRESHIRCYLPSVYNIDAWQDTDFFAPEVTRADTLAHLHLILCTINEMERNLDENHFIATPKKIKCSN